MYRVLICATAAVFIGNQAVAQEKQHVSFKVPDQNIKYNISQNVEIGDVPNHIIRLFDSRGVLNETVSVSGVELGEVSVRGVGEMTNGIGGSNSSYLVFVGKNGDKFFSSNRVIIQGGGQKLSAIWVGQIEGGTGKFVGLQGATHAEFFAFDPRPGGSPGGMQIDIDYSIGK
jgi:hypothetical protein